MLNPGKPAPNPQPGSALASRLSEEWPYPLHYDSVLAAPNNYRLLYEDGHVRLLEVTVRPGETTPAHGNPYASVLAFNTVAVDEQEIVDTKLDPKSPLNGRGLGRVLRRAFSI